MSKHSPSSYRDVLRAYVGVWNDGRTERLDALVAPGFVRVADPLSESVTGRDALSRLVGKMRDDMPDLVVGLEDMIIEGGRAATRWQLTGTDTGPGDFPPTGRRIDVLGVSFFELVDGVLAREWTIADSLTALQQLGFSLNPPAQDADGTSGS